MTTEQLKDWLKGKTDTGQGIQVGSIDGNAEKCIGVYLRETSGGQRVCLGGPVQTLTQTMRVAILVHWTRSAVQAEAKAREVWSLLYGLTGTDMAGAWVYCADPGAGPIPVGRDQRGVFEYVVRAELIYKKE